MATGISARLVAPTTTSCLASVPSVDELACAGRADLTSRFDLTTFPSSSLSLPSSSSSAWGVISGEGAGVMSSSHGQAVSGLWRRRSSMGGYGGASGAVPGAPAAEGHNHGLLQLCLDVVGSARAAASPHYHCSFHRRRCSTRRTADGGESSSNTGSNGSRNRNRNRGSEEGLSGGKDGEEAMDNWSALAAEDEEDGDENVEKAYEDGENMAKKNVTNEKKGSWSWRDWWASARVPREEKLIQEVEGEVEKERREKAEGEGDGEDVERARGVPEIVVAAADAESEEGDGDGLEEKGAENTIIRSSKAKGGPKKGEEANVGFWRRAVFWKQNLKGDDEEELEPEDELLLQDLESLSFNWKEIVDPTWENLLALGLTALLAAALLKISMQLLGVVLTILLEALKYTVLASIVLGLLIFFL